MNNTKLFAFLLITGSIFTSHCEDQPRQYKVGLLIVATGKYTVFIPPLIESAEHFFLPNHHRTYFIFTNRPDQIPQRDNIIIIPQEQLPWPFITMMRCQMYCRQRELLEEFDYLFATDADMRFVNLVSDEILSDLVATRHPGFINKDRKPTYETNPVSTAYISDQEGEYYFAGGFYGGKTEQFIEMNETMCKNILSDLDHNLIAIWHDESHLNHYFWHHKPSCILSPSYCYAEGSGIPFVPRLVALNKNHAEMRSN